MVAAGITLHNKELVTAPPSSKVCESLPSEFMAKQTTLNGVPMGPFSTAARVPLCEIIDVLYLSVEMLPLTFQVTAGLGLESTAHKQSTSNPFITHEEELRTMNGLSGREMKIEMMLSGCYQQLCQ